MLAAVKADLVLPQLAQAKEVQAMRPESVSDVMCQSLAALFCATFSLIPDPTAARQRCKMPLATRLHRPSAPVRRQALQLRREVGHSTLSKKMPCY